YRDGDLVNSLARLCQAWTAGRLPALTPRPPWLTKHRADACLARLQAQLDAVVREGWQDPS
ncbi:MAG: hypothetical protein AAFX85_07980, partial [Pseudomonadota bacterium]